MRKQRFVLEEVGGGGQGEGGMTRQDYFTHFEPSQSYGGAKTGDPPRKTIVQDVCKGDETKP